MYFFFFSSRRRHTRLVRDWSSDVCSSDLPIATYSENQLIRAEASARSSFASGLTALNSYRAWLAGGGRLNANFDLAANYMYDPYVEADFASGGMENADGLTKENALLQIGRAHV